MVSGNPLYDSGRMDDEVIKEGADPETKRLVNLVKVTLRILGLSNREVARRLGMSPSYLSKLLSGASVRVVRLDGSQYTDVAEPEGRHDPNLLQLDRSEYTEVR